MGDNNRAAEQAAIVAFPANMHVVFISMFTLAINSYADFVDMSNMSYVIRLASAFVFLLLLFKTSKLCLIFRSY